MALNFKYFSLYFYHIGDDLTILKGVAMRDFGCLFILMRAHNIIKLRVT